MTDTLVGYQDSHLLSTKKRVLCVGFSVTEMFNSYVPRADQISKSEYLPYEFHKCGIGGIGLETLAYLINDILDMHSSFKDIVFEIATGAGRNEFSGRRKGLNDITLLKYVEQIAVAGLRRGISIGFFNLPRLDADYAQDHFELAIFAVCNVYDIPVYSVTYKAYLENRDLQALLPDKVHVNEAGADHYARSLIEFVSRGLSGKTSHTLAPSSLFCSNVPDDLQFPYRYFDRHGFSAKIVQIPESGMLQWELPSDVNMHGITFISGPTAGMIDITVDGALLESIQTYDQYCYYERFNSAFFKPTRGTTLTISVRDEVPTIPLLKGEPSLSPRQVGFGHLLYGA